MKNIHLIPTDNSSRLYYNENKSKVILNNTIAIDWYISEGYKAHNIYITSSEEVNKTDYVIVSCSEAEIEAVNLVTGYYNEQFLFDDRTQIHMNYCRKIILTTDQDLIKDGVQGIDDEFLEWFVKNSSCEKLEINWIIKAYSIKKEYTIVIPKQETLEEVAEKWFNEQGFNIYNHYDTRPAFIEGAKWQQEQYRWKTVSEETPPNNIELLVKSPEGVVHLSNWRESYNIFTCQAKSESSYNWKWKKI